MLWIALYLPQLPLQLVQRFLGLSAGHSGAEGSLGLSAGHSGAEGSLGLSAGHSGVEGSGATKLPCVIADGPLLRPLVLCANTIAGERGVRPDMTVAAARALAGELVVLPRDTIAEAQALHNLGCWASQFTPSVVLQPGEGLLLEVSTVLQLHGGLSRLLIRLGQGMKDLGYHAEPGVAPTAIAAWVLAKARHAKLRVRMCRDSTLLPERLAALPLPLLDWPADVLQKLHTLGIRRIGDCVNLPRDGFIQRFGAAKRLELDRMLDTASDPRAWFTPPDTFTSRLEFGFEVNDALMLLFPLKRLLQELEGFLRGRGAGVQHWQLVLEHMSHRTTTLDMRTAAPERSAERFLVLARERLAQAELAGPVLGLSIAAEKLQTYEESSRTFIPDPRSRAIGWGQLVDKLATRLGADKVYRLRAVDDHRPEQAWQQSDAAAPCVNGVRPSKTLDPRMRGGDENSRGGDEGKRPLWLLRTPRTLLSDEGKPLCQGRLRLVAGPERIESGWWDGQNARRDYYVARNSKGETFWIYREHRRSKDWYLHGIFS